VRTHYVVPVFLIIWLVVGALAAGQRGYYHQSDPSCGSVGSMLVTVLAGPLNYFGINPEVNCPEVPEPSE